MKSRLISTLGTAKNLIPWPVRRISRQVKRQIRWARSASVPMSEVFRVIYQNDGWGGYGSRPYYSGPGSDVRHARAYAARIRNFMATQQVTSIVDLGCGDFRVGAMLVTDGVQYTGIDIVEDLVRFNSRRFACSTIRFECLDITQNSLPDGELCLIREVLQHLSNSEILRILPKLEKYRHIIYTDYQPPPWAIRQPNLDIPHGRDTRIWKRSGLYLDQPPFNLRTELLFEAAVSPHLCIPGERIASQ
jgi:SAM-dependent methyltransferase